ncbi:MAG: HAD-IIB family hydrolase [Methylotenera sp.]|nr:HAD-IIB family hydrolase [Oligoflexia bacterium]
MNKNLFITAHPAPWESASEKELRKVKGVCLDIDDTLSTHGKLTAEAYQALWNLKNAGFFVVPVTGRPAGWCDHFARFWPVDAIIGENGAFIFYMHEGKRKRLDTLGAAAGTEVTRKQNLEELGIKILARYPFAKWASDQSYREYDLAIDICEDVQAWKSEDVQGLLELCHAQGAKAKLSSIHVNAWFGEFDKRKGFENWMKLGYPGLENARGPDSTVLALPAENEWLFIGDSPNDEPLFATFEFSVGVANLKKYLSPQTQTQNSSQNPAQPPALTHPPRWLTQAESGAGFVQMSDRLVALRKARG